MLGTADNGRENRTWCIITSKTGFAHSRSIIHHKCLYVVVSHFLYINYKFMQEKSKKITRNPTTGKRCEKISKMWCYLQENKTKDWI